MGTQDIVSKILDSGSTLTVRVQQTLLAQALATKAIEAALFRVTVEPQGPKLHTVSHIRPDDTNQEARQKAIDAFKRILTPCAAQGRPGRFHLVPDQEPANRYCLGIPWFAHNELKAVAGLIVRAESADAADHLILAAQSVAERFMEVIFSPPEDDAF